LACKDIDKTNTYIQRSRECPLEAHVHQENFRTLLLVAPHIGRLKALTLSFIGQDACWLVKHLSATAPLLEKLTIYVYNSKISEPDIALFGSTLLNGNLSSLHDLHLSCFTPNLPW